MSRQSSKPSASVPKPRRRTFSTEFKHAKVRQIESDIVTVAQVAREFDVSTTSVYKWLELFGTQDKATQVVVQLQSEEYRTRLLRNELSELERVVGRKQIELDYLHALIDLSSRELGIDLKKTFASRPSTSSDSEATPETGR
jgi:transposase